MRTKIIVGFQVVGDNENLLPQRAHLDDAAFDLRSRIDVTLPIGKSTLVPLGFCMELPVGYVALITPRSGISLKHDITATNSPGIIDAGYRGEVGFIAYNAGSEEYHVKVNERVGQMTILELPEIEIVVKKELSKTERGAGGFGSTGKHEVKI